MWVAKLVAEIVHTERKQPRVERSRNQRRDENCAARPVVRQMTAQSMSMQNWRRSSSDGGD